MEGVHAQNTSVRATVLLNGLLFRMVSYAQEMIQSPYANYTFNGNKEAQAISLGRHDRSYRNTMWVPQLLLTSCTEENSKTEQCRGRRTSVDATTVCARQYPPPPPTPKAQRDRLATYDPGHIRCGGGGTQRRGPMQFIKSRNLSQNRLLVTKAQ